MNHAGFQPLEASRGLRNFGMDVTMLRFSLKLYTDSFLLGTVLPPQGTFGNVETFLIDLGGCYWHLMGRDQGWQNAQGRLPQQNYPV